jgi:hypothetical protein
MNTSLIRRFSLYSACWAGVAAEESAVPFARDLHPEFGYVGSSPRIFRRLRLVLSFVVLGIVGGASGVAIFMASPDSDPGTSAKPLDAMALAPAEALIEPKLALPAAPRPVGASAVERNRMWAQPNRHVVKALARTKVTVSGFANAH